MVVAGDVDQAFERYFDWGGTHHNVFTPPGLAALRKGMNEAHARFPEKEFTIHHVLGDEDLVAVHSRLSLENDQPPMSVVHLFRFSNGKIVEMWDVAQAIPNDSLNTVGAF